MMKLHRVIRIKPVSYTHLHLGGMWDYLGVDENGVVDTVLEMKTTQRIEDWQNDAPEYYALQAALYAYPVSYTHLDVYKRQHVV